MVAIESDGVFFRDGAGDFHEGGNTFDRNVGVLHGNWRGLLFGGVCRLSPIEERVLGCALSGVGDLAGCAE